MSGPVVAICGLPGSGKTSLALSLSRRFGWPALHYDDYETATVWPVARLRRWLEAGCDYGEIDLGDLTSDIAAAARESAVLVDTLLGRAHPSMAGMVDLAIWIDTPADVALSRKIRESAARAVGDAGEAAFVNWLEGWLALYDGLIANAYRIQEERVRPRCEVVLDGRQAADVVAGHAAAAIAAYMETERR